MPGGMGAGAGMGVGEDESGAGGMGGMPGGMGGMPGSMGGMPGGMGGMPGAMGGNQGGRAAARGALVKYRLFRFFDMSVEPGKTYQYRVRIHFKNPNEGVKTRFLADPALASGETRASEWCVPTSAIAVPRDNHVLAGTVRPAGGNMEARATLMVVKWDQQTAVNAVVEKKDMVRGTLFNFSEDVLLAKSATGTAAAKQKVNFATDLLLVDISGGEVLPGAGKAARASDILVMGPDGELAIQSQFADASAYIQEAERLKSLDKKPAETTEGDGSNGPGLFGAAGGGAGGGPQGPGLGQGAGAN